MIEIPLTKGYVAVVDDEDAHLAALNWCACEKDGLVYAQRRVNYKLSYLHCEILRVPGGLVDHRNGNTLDCRRANLRPATKAQNAQNSGKPSTNTSGFKGVSFMRRGCALRKPWLAQIKANGAYHYLGTFATPEEAARAHDEAARRLHGEFAWLNFPADLRGSGVA